MNAPKTSLTEWIGRRGYATGAAAIALFIVYGSLVPFRFRSITFSQALDEFSAVLSGMLFIDSRTDFVTNILLTIPLSYLTCAALMTDRRGFIRRVAVACLTLALSMALSVSVEFAQVFTQARTDSLSDIIAQTIGTLLGLTTFLAVGDRVTTWLRDALSGREQPELLQRILLVYCVLFAIIQVLPLDLTLSLGQLAGKYRRGMILIEPFVGQYPSVFEQWMDYLSTLALAVPIGAAAALLWSDRRSRRSPVLAFVIALAGVTLVAFAQVFVASRIADATYIVLGGCGAALGVVVATTLSRGDASPRVQGSTNASVWPSRMGVIASIAALVFYHWNPFDFSTAPARLADGMHLFLSLPFYSYYRGTDFHAFMEIVRKALVAAPLGVFLRLSWSARDRARDSPSARLVAAAAFGFAVLVAIEIGQIFLPTRVPDITDSIVGEMGLLTALWLTDRVIASLPVHGPGFDAAPMRVHVAGVPETIDRLADVNPDTGASRRTLASIGLVAAVAGITFGIRTILALPGIPYNVASLFLDHGSIAAVAIFSLALLWIGAGPLLLARWLGRSRYSFLIFPLGMILLAMVSRTLLKYSVTYESLDDILGTNNLFSRVAHDNVWGDFWRHAFLTTNAVDLVDYFERRVRYIALYSPFAGCLTLSFLSLRHPRNWRPSFAFRDGAWLALSAIVWIMLSKFVIFDWAATDNLTELVAGPGLLGWSGLPWLLLTVVLFAGNVALAVRATESGKYLFVVLICSLAAIPMAYWLVQLGLEPHVAKYGLTFSALQFLLGPDRQHVLSASSLFVRWTAVYAAGLAVIASGAWIAQAFVISRDRDARFRTGVPSEMNDLFDERLRDAGSRDDGPTTVRA